MKDKKISILQKYHTKTIRLIIIILIFCISIIPIATIAKYILTSKYTKYELLVSLLFISEIIIFLYLFKVVINNNRLRIDKFELTKKLICIVSILNYFFIGFLRYGIHIEYKSLCFSIILSLFLDTRLIIKTNIELCIITIFIYIVEVIFLNRYTLLIGNVILNFITIIILMILITILVYFTEKILLEEEIKEIKYKEDYYNRIENKQKEIKELRHNIKNKIIILKSQVNNGNIKEANIIMDKIISKTENNKVGIYTNNVEINFMLNSKISQSKNYNIKWNVDIKVPVNINIDSSDIGIILGNILDNSIEACIKVKEFERIIDVTIYYKKSAIIINIKNSKSIYYNSDDTWKKDKENHGLGLKSVEKVINKYSGILSYEDKVNSYEVNIIIWDI